MVAGLKGETYEEKCAELGLQTLEERRKIQDMTLVHKFLTSEKESSLFVRSTARTRQAAGIHSLTVQYARTDPRKNSFAVRTVENWNGLPDAVKAAPDGEAFRRMLKQ